MKQMNQERSRMNDGQTTSQRSRSDEPPDGCAPGLMQVNKGKKTTEKNSSKTTRAMSLDASALRVI